MPPASPAATLVLRMASRIEVFPWSTWPRTVTMGGRSRSLEGSSLASEKSSSRVVATTAPSPSPDSTATTSSEAIGSTWKPNSSATISAVPKSMTWLIVAMIFDWISFLITSTELTPSRSASSLTVTVGGSTILRSPLVSTRVGAALAPNWLRAASIACWERGADALRTSRCCLSRLSSSPWLTPSSRASSWTFMPELMILRGPVRRHAEVFGGQAGEFQERVAGGAGARRRKAAVGGTHRRMRDDDRPGPVTPKFAGNGLRRPGGLGGLAPEGRSHFGPERGVDGGFQGSLQRAAAAGELHAVGAGVQVGAATRGAAGRVEPDLAGGGAHQAQEAALAGLLAAGDAGPYRLTPGLWHSRASAPYPGSRDPASEGERGLCGGWAPSSAAGLMSIRQPVSLAASRAFCPSRPMASDSCARGTTTEAVRVARSTFTSSTEAGPRAAATKRGGSSDQGTMSTCSPPSSLKSERWRIPLGPTQAPTGSMPG